MTGRGPAPSVVFGPADPREDPAAALLAEMGVELNALYGATDRLDHPALDPAMLLPPAGRYLVGRQDGAAVAGGGVRALPGAGPGVGEVKRMFVRPPARSRGLAGLLLAALEQAALDLGYTTVRLDTGPRQPHARALYERAGYRPVPRYNDNPYATFFGEKILVP